MKPVALPPGRARLSTKPAPTGSGTCANTIGTVRVACSNGARVASPTGQDDIRRERDQFRRVSTGSVGIARPPAIVDPHVAADGPAQFLQPLQERSDAGLRFRIVRDQVREHADATHPLGLLRARRERPRSRRAAEERDELAPFHRRMSPALQTERLAHLGGLGDLLRCGISNRPMSARGHERRFRYLRGTFAYPPRLAVKADIPDWQVRAKNGLMHCSKEHSLFDHFVGNGEQRRRHGDA